MQALLRYALVATPLAVLMFLALAGFFSSWDGHVVSHRPARVEDPAVFTVLIVTDDGDGTEHDWPADLVRTLDLDIDPTGTPPRTVPDDAAATSKSRFAMHFTLTPPDGPTRVQPTLQASALYIPVLAWLVGLFLHNMWLSGSPFSLERRETVLPEGNLDPSRDRAGSGGSGSGGGPRTRGRQGPPPPKPRRGRGRRR